RGEIYLRWLQRLSSLAFGTRPGRFLMRYLVLPYGVAYVALEGTLHLIHLVQRWTGQQRSHLTPEETWVTVAVLGTFAFALINAPPFRRQLLKLLRFGGGLLRRLFLDIPAAVLRLPLVQRVVASKPFALVRDTVIKPAAVAALVAAVFPLYAVRAGPAWITTGVIFVLLSVLLNTRAGRTIEEAVTDALVRTWLRFTVTIFPALFDFTMRLFRGLVEAVERGLYTVD